MPQFGSSWVQCLLIDSLQYGLDLNVAVYTDMTVIQSCELHQAINDRVT
jgi:hypothetical protein